MKKTFVIIIALVCSVLVSVTGCREAARKRFTNETIAGVPYEVVKDSVTGYFGFRSKDGTHCIACVYDSVKPFHERTAAVCKDGLWGCVDAEGMLVVPCRYENLRLLGNGVARVGDNGLYGLVTTDTGDTLLDVSCSSITVFNDDFLLLSKDGRCGLMNERLAIVTPDFYDTIFPMQDGLIRVAMEGRYGLLDSTGREVLNCMFDRIEPFSGERARVKAGTMYGLIDRAGRLVLPCIYTEVKECAASRAYIVSKLGRMGVVDRDGNRLIRTENDCIETVGDRIWLACRDGEYAFYDRNGNPTTGQRYDRVRYLSDKLACVEANGKFGLINLFDGQEIHPCQFDRVGSFQDGYAAVRNGKWGYIDSDGTVIIPCRYDVAKPFQDGRARVVVDGRWMVIDVTGMEIAGESAEL